MIKRTICDIVLFGSLVWLPWWATAGLAVLFMIFFKKYWEGVVVALMIDLFYAVSSINLFADMNLYGRFGIFTVVALAIFFIIENAKKRVRFFSN